MVELLKWANATVTSCNIYSKNVDSICQMADIIVAAVGHGHLVKEGFQIYIEILLSVA